MSYKQIDEQFSDEYDKGMFRNDTATGDRRLRMWLIDFLHQIYNQAKAEQREENAKVEEKYNELIMAVGNKYPGETRHKTALRYIKNAENSNHTATAIRQEGK